MNIVSETTLSIPHIVKLLKNGGVIVYPTETTYGLGCDMNNAHAVERIFDIKQRQHEKSVLVVASDIAMIQEFVVWNVMIDRLAEKYWPGPVTIVASLKEGVVLPTGVVGPDNTLAFRVTSHPLAVAICKELQGPLVSTSANISSLSSPYDIRDVRTMFEGKQCQPDMIIDGGILPHQPPSTIVKVVDDTIEILRQGEIVVEVN